MDFIDDIVEWLGKFWDTLVQYFWWIVDSLLTLLGWALVGLLTYILKGLGYIFFTICDGALVFVHGFFAGLDLSAIAFNSSIGGELNQQLVWLIDQTGVVQCVTILVAAISLRVLLNLIPATITRV